MAASGKQRLGLEAFASAAWLEVRDTMVTIPAYLSAVLDRGEAAVIMTALQEKVPLVCIDDTAGRRVARVSGLTVAGAIGVLVKAKQQGFPVLMAEAVARLREQGIWLGREVAQFALDADHGG